MEAGQQDYYSRVNKNLAALVPQDARRVLEVGCGSGALAKYLKNRIPGLAYVGVEANPSAAENATAVMDRILVGDAESISNADIQGERCETMDCIVYGDVLEHLVDPWALLRRHRGMLSENGVVVASIPNLQYWKVVGRIITDTWRYEDEGPLDRTHLRWFTRVGVVELFKRNDFVIDKLLYVMGDTKGIDSYCDAMAEVVRRSGVDPQTFKTLSGALQFLVLARKTAT